jgi:hypothetical protein
MALDAGIKVGRIIMRNTLCSIKDGLLAQLVVCLVSNSDKTINSYPRLFVYAILERSR